MAPTEPGKCLPAMLLGTSFTQRFTELALPMHLMPAKKVFDCGMYLSAPFAGAFPQK